MINQKSRLAFIHRFIVSPTFSSRARKKLYDAFTSFLGMGQRPELFLLSELCRLAAISSEH
jgi:hypothetical protein